MDYMTAKHGAENERNFQQYCEELVTDAISDLLNYNQEATECDFEGAVNERCYNNEIAVVYAFARQIVLDSDIQLDFAKDIELPAVVTDFGGINGLCERAVESELRGRCFGLMQEAWEKHQESWEQEESDIELVQEAQKLTRKELEQELAGLPIISAGDGYDMINIRFDPKAHSDHESAAIALYKALRLACFEYGANPDFEVSIFTPKQNQIAGYGQSWGVGYESGPYDWAIGASFKISGAGWHTEPYYGFDLHFAD